MPPFGQFNPAQVLMRPPRPGGFNSAGLIPSGPYVGGPQPKPQPPTYSGIGARTTVPALQSPSNVVGPESVRATGTGPFDQSYRQNLATYGGGQYARPGGSMSFNPTDLSTFPGQPTGGGNAPVAGMPLSLLDMALGGQPFSWAPPPPPTAGSPSPAMGNTNAPNLNQIQDWLNQFLMGGRGMRIS